MKLIPASNAVWHDAGAVVVVGVADLAEHHGAEAQAAHDHAGPTQHVEFHHRSPVSRRGRSAVPGRVRRPGRRGSASGRTAATGNRNQCTRRGGRAGAPASRSARRAGAATTPTAAASPSRSASGVPGSVCERRPDLVQRQADLLGDPDERDPTQRVTGVAPLPTRRAGRVDEALGLVVAQGRRRDPGPLAQRTDRQLRVHVAQATEAGP